MPNLADTPTRRQRAERITQNRDTVLPRARNTDQPHLGVFADMRDAYRGDSVAETRRALGMLNETVADLGQASNIDAAIRAPAEAGRASLDAAAGKPADPVMAKSLAYQETYYKTKAEADLNSWQNDTATALQDIIDKGGSPGDVHEELMKRVASFRDAALQKYPTATARALVGQGMARFASDLDVRVAQQFKTKTDQDMLDTIGSNLIASLDRGHMLTQAAIQPDPLKVPLNAPVGSPSGVPMVGPNAPRGLRNNNPLNVSELGGGKKWDGQTGNDGRYPKFATIDKGFAAADDNLLAYAKRHGISTLRGIISRWAPRSENDTAAYIRTVAGDLGIGADQKLDLLDPDVRRKVLLSMAKVETGQDITPYLGQGADQPVTAEQPVVGPHGPTWGIGGAFEQALAQARAAGLDPKKAKDSLRAAVIVWGTNPDDPHPDELQTLLYSTQADGKTPSLSPAEMSQVQEAVITARALQDRLDKKVREDKAKALDKTLFDALGTGHDMSPAIEAAVHDGTLSAAEGVAWKNRFQSDLNEQLSGRENWQTVSGFRLRLTEANVDIPRVREEIAQAYNHGQLGTGKAAANAFVSLMQATSERRAMNSADANTGRDYLNQVIRPDSEVLRGNQPVATVYFQALRTYEQIVSQGKPPMEAADNVISKFQPVLDKWMNGRPAPTPAPAANAAVPHPATNEAAAALIRKQAEERARLLRQLKH